ncbi:MAG: hypothetical protein H7Y03_04610 [Chitinophagaceae bacterium]|nr:hypothetical protein [Chitinophagaceae bacterium]
MQTFISIAEPCNENWDKMQPNQQGRHCLSCSKTVVDFTGWDTPDIAAYLLNPANKKACGRFYDTQLNVPILPQKEEWIHCIQRSCLSGAKKVAAIIVIVFGLTQTACQKLSTPGKAITPPIEKTITLGVPLPENTEYMRMGETMILIDEPATKDSIPKCQPDTAINKTIKIGKVAARSR